MTTPAYPSAISLANIQTEFGGSNPIGLNEYYYGGSYNITGSTYIYGFTPSSGQISFNTLQGCTKATGYFVTEIDIGSGAPNGAGSGSGTNQTQYGLSGVSIDSSGNIYVAGYLSTGSPSSSTPSGCFAKLNSNGVLQWFKSTYYVTAAMGFCTVKVLPNGNILFAFQANSATSTAWMVLNSSGSLVGSYWNTTMPNTGSCVVDSSNYLYFGVSKSTSDYNYDSGVWKFDQSATNYFSKRLRTAYTDGYDVCNGITLDGSGNIYLTGQNRAFAGQPIAMYVLKCDSTGAPVWSTTVGQSAASSTNYCYGLATKVNSSGYSYSWGYGNAKLDGSTTTAYALLAKWDSSGSIQFKRYVTSGSSAASANSMAMDSSGNYYIMASISGVTGCVVFKYNSSDVLQWQRFTSLVGHSIEVSSDGTYLVLVGKGNFATGTNNSYTTYAVMKVPTDGSRTGTFTYSYGWNASSYSLSSTSVADSSTTFYDGGSWPSGTSYSIGSIFDASYCYQNFISPMY